MTRPRKHSHPSDRGLRPSVAFLVLALALQPNSLLACAACYGQSDSPLAAGMNWGILSLLGIITVVLGCVAGFFIYLARRAAKADVGRASVSASPVYPILPEQLGLADTLTSPSRADPLLYSPRQTL